MRLRLTPVLLLACLSACSPQPGRLRITVVFENETQTQCIRPTARSSAGVTAPGQPPTVRRPMNTDTLLIGLSENADLKGEVTVRIVGYATADCTGMETFDEEKSATISRGGEVAMLQFVVRGVENGDGGVDGGTDAGTDGGVDAGCNPSACLNAPGSCEGLPATGCAGDGGCRFTITPMAACGDAGACNASGACVPACSVRPLNAPCDDGLLCTTASACTSMMTCVGTACPGAPQCQELVTPLTTCSASDPLACATTPSPDDESCTTQPSSRCLAGQCQPWLPFQPRNFDGGITSVTYPATAWTLGDGGVCDTVISTSGPAATVLDGGCGSPAITSTVDAAGNSVITMTGLDVATNARLHFVGTRPVQLLVLGDATVRGLVSVSPTVAGLQPAGANASGCSTAQNGDAADEGGGGGGFGGAGEVGGNSGGAGGLPNSSTDLPLRGGCPGGNGFRNSGNSAGGVGGGALQMIVRGVLVVSGTIAAAGGGGSPGTSDGEGGGGGGSGGTVILEASAVNLNGGFVTANGGGGGEGGDTGSTSQRGSDGLLSSASRAPGGSSSNGGNGGSGGSDADPGGQVGASGTSSRGGGGGGGGAGVIFVGARMTCVRGSGVLSGFKPTTVVCP
jgi:hypothetical protein